MTTVVLGGRDRSCSSARSGLVCGEQPLQLKVDAGEAVLRGAGGAAQHAAKGAGGGERLIGLLQILGLQQLLSAGEPTPLPSPQLADLSGGIVRAGRVRTRS